MTRKERIARFFRHEPGAELPDFEQDTKMVFHPVCERPFSGTGYDVFSVHWTDTSTTPHYTPGQPPIISDFDNWENELKVPKVDNFDWSDLKRQNELIDRDEYPVFTIIMMGPFERATTLTSFEDCLCAFLEEPEAMYGIIGAIADYKIELIKKINSIAKLDVIMLHDDWGTENSLFLNPETWREIIKPHVKRIYDVCKELDIFIIGHSCGKAGLLIEDMIDAGIDAWEGQSNCNDIPALREKYGDRIGFIPRAAAVLDESEEPPPEMLPGYEEKPVFLYE